MNLEKQNFPPVNLLTLYAGICGAIKRIINEERIPLTIEQLPVIMCIHDLGIVCQQEIADFIFRDKSSVQRTVSKLDEKGLVQTLDNGMDKRKKMLSLTNKGKEIAEKIAGSYPDFDDLTIVANLGRQL